MSGVRPTVCDVANGVSLEAPRMAGVSCHHAWLPRSVPGEFCAWCAATCKRDSSGRIVDYSTVTSREIEAEQKARRAAEELIALDITLEVVTS